MATRKSTLNMVALKGAVVFPSVSTHLDVGRTKSINALESAMSSNQLIFLSCQKDPTVSEPKKEDLYEIGTVAKLKQILKLPNGAIRAFFDGQYVAKLINVIDQDGYLSCEIEEVEVVESSELEVHASVSLLRDAVENFEKALHRAPSDEIEKVFITKHPTTIANHLADMMPLSFEKQQAILEIVDPKTQHIELAKIINQEQKIQELKLKLEQDVKTAIDAHQREYFLREQLKVVQQELNKKDGHKDEYHEILEKIERAGMPKDTLEKVKKEFNRYQAMPQTSPESTMTRAYINWMIDLPWAKKSKSNIEIKKVKEVLDSDHSGLDKVKDRILEYLAVQKVTNSLKAPIICLVGPPGVGKTSLAKSIAIATKRKFVRISLGGVRDEAEIRGHRRTYIGAMPGRIIQGLKKAGTCNPVFLLDEIDKMSSDFRGDPSSAMLEVLDPEQNHSFSDHYIEETFDLSQVMFIATANNLSSIPTPLLDRMEIIDLSSYTEIEKLSIALNHLIPKQLKEHGLDKKINVHVQVEEDAIFEVIRRYTREAGVRGLERKIGTICRKIVRKYVETNDSSYVVDRESIQTYLGKPIFEYRQSEPQNLVGVATGLAYTSFGGDTLEIEVSISKGKGRLVLTGKLGDVMKESAQTALSYVRSMSSKLGIDHSFFEKNDIHIHVPEGAVPKDGPSAGITITTALVSAITNKPVNKDIGMTGEVTLRGRVLPIGGLKEKSISAHRSGLRKIICPAKNEKDLEDIPAIVKEEIEFLFVTEVSEVLKEALVFESKDEVLI